jgi:opacity protein-like surface antigen
MLNKNKTMQQSYKILLGLIICSYCFHANAQSFEKEDKIIEAGFGLGIYDTQLKQKSTGIKENDKAGAWVFPLSFEYAYHKRLAIGMGYKYSSFITNNDSTFNNEQMHGHDIVLKPTFHIIKSKVVDMYIGALAGLSWVNYQVNDLFQSSVKGNGTILAFTFGTRFYVSKKIALSINYAYNNYHYNDLTVSNILGYKDYFDLNLSRGNVGIGLSYKFKK